MNTSEVQLAEYRSNSYSEIYSRFSSFRNATPLSRTNSRQYPPTSKDCQEHPDENGPDNGQRKIGSASLIITPRNSSATSVRLQTRESLNCRGSSASRKNSATNGQRSHSAVYKTHELNESQDKEYPIEIEKEIVKGNQIVIAPDDTLTFENTITPIKEIHELENDAKKPDGNIYPEKCLSMTSPRYVDRANLSSRGSSLMLGSGKIRKSNDTETLELHIDESELSTVQDQILSHVVSVTIGTSKANTPSFGLKESKLSPRPFEAVLPKTFITKSGSLLLYSDSELLKGTDDNNISNGQNDKKDIRIKGRSVSPRTLVPQAYPYWGKHVNRGTQSRNTNTNSTGFSKFGWIKKEQRGYIGINKQNSMNKPYSWDYTVLPSKLIDDSDTDVIKTVSNLSEAVLAYQSTRPSSKEKYLAMIKQSRGSLKTQAEKMSELQAGQLQRLSTWTREWVGLHGPVPFKHAGQPFKDNEADKALITKLRKTLKKKVQTPANTPSKITKQTYVHNLNKMEFGKLLTNTPRGIDDTDENFASSIYK